MGTKELNSEKENLIYFRHPNDDRKYYKSKIPYNVPPSYSTFITKTTTKTVKNVTGIIIIIIIHLQNIN